VVIFGSNGALGRAVSRRFERAEWQSILCDVTQPTVPSSTFLKIPVDASVMTQYELLETEILAKFGSKRKVDAVINVGGGFRMDNVASNEIFNNLRLMYSSSVECSFVASHLAAKFLREDGTLVLPGAAAAAKPTPWAVSYGCMKSAVHHLVKSIAANGGLPKGATTIGIAPVMLDTPANRESMPGSDFSNWTPVDELADLIFSWADKTRDVVNGSIYKIETAQGKTTTSAI
jgi:dihydropteridine reductase